MQAPSPGNPAQPPASSRRLGRWWWVVGLAIAIAVVVVLAPLASSDPDGLERVAEDNGFIAQAENFIAGLLGDYAIPGVDDSAVSTILAGLLGLAILVGVVVLLGRLLARRRGVGAPGPGARPLRRGRQPVPPRRRPDQVRPGDRGDPVRSACSRSGRSSRSCVVWLVLVACSATAGLGPFRLARAAVVALPFTLAAFPLIFTVEGQTIATIDLGPARPDDLRRGPAAVPDDRDRVAGCRSRSRCCSRSRRPSTTWSTRCASCACRGSWWRSSRSCTATSRSSATRRRA